MNTIFKNIVVICAVIGAHKIVDVVHDMYEDYIVRKSLTNLIINETRFMRDNQEQKN